MAGSIEGLGSGLNTSSIVRQLMAVEKQSQTRLSAQRQTVLARGTAWTAIGTQLTSLQGALDKVKSGGLAATTATSSAPSVASVTGTASTPGVHEVAVTQLAAAQRFTTAKMSPTDTFANAGQLAFHDGSSTIGATTISTSTAPTGTYKIEVLSVAGTDATVRVGTGTPQVIPVTGGSLTIPLAGGATGSIDVAGNLKVGTASLTVAKTEAGATLADVAKAVNSAAGSLSAVVVSDGATPPQARLVLSGTKTGDSANVTMTSTYDGALTESALTSPVDPTSPTDPLAGSTAALDAKFTFNDIPVSRASNTVTDLIPGTSVTLLSKDKTTITVAGDPAANLAAGKAVVDTLNAVLRQVATGTKYDQAAKKSGPLTGDSGARSLARELTAAVTDAAKGISGITLGGAPTTDGAAYTTTNLGISLQKDGTYAFDSAAFEAALRDKPAETRAFVDAIATELQKVVTRATSPTGVVSASKKGASDLAAHMQKQVDAWDDKLALVENRLRRQFSALDSAMASLNSQGTWLAGQIAGLTGGG